MRRVMTQKAGILRALLLIFMVFAFSADLFAARITGDQSKSPASQEKKKKAKIKKTPKAEDNRFNMDFSADSDIHELIKFVSDLTHENFVVDKKVKGKINIICPTKVTPEEAYQVFLSVLEVNGYATVKAGAITKIIPSPDARAKNIMTRLTEEGLSDQDKVVTQLISLDYAKADAINKLFKPMISKSSLMVAYSPTNTLIVTDVMSNIKRLLRIIRVIDVLGVGEELSVIPLENASATDMTKLASTLFQKKKSSVSSKKRAATGDVVRIVADERTNSLVVLASQDDTAAIRALVDLLDREVPKGKGKIRVYYLQNATAEDVAKVLQNLPGKKADPRKKGQAPIISRDVQISADKATNSLIITAEKNDYLILEEVIKKLDIPRAMVYIEALIMEVSTDKAFELGVEWRGGDDFIIEGHKSVGFAGSGGAGTKGAYSLFPSAASLLAGGDPFPSGFSVGMIGESIKVGDITFPTIGALMRAYKNDSDVHILSAPHILTTNNEEAEIYVGKNVPYVTKQETSSSNVDYSSYEYRDVGVTLKITPQISQERLVRLQVFQEVTRLIETAGTTTQPTTFKRKTDTTVIVKDGNTIVIGGLIDESTEGVTYRVPCLGDIPGLGWLFKSVTEKREKTNLYVFLTPRIIENPKEAREVYKEKRKAIKNVEAGVIELYKRKEGMSIPIDDYLKVSPDSEDNSDSNADQADGKDGES